MELVHARQAAADVAALLAPACERIEVAGSIRRERPEVKDLELVAIAKQGGRPVWGEPATAAGPLEGLVARLLQTRQLALDPALKRLGAKYKRLLYIRGAIRLPVDLFIVAPENWGNQLVIRTGNAEWSHLLVTPRRQGGFMPDDMWHKDGYLWRAKDCEEGEVVPCPEESDFFREMGLPLAPPADRNADTALRLRRELAADEPGAAGGRVRGDGTAHGRADYQRGQRRIAAHRG
jgi:DNA polymerase/3'-5' exonuclease PolX